MDQENNEKRIEDIKDTIPQHHTLDIENDGGKLDGPKEMCKIDNTAKEYNEDEEDDGINVMIEPNLFQKVLLETFQSTNIFNFQEPNSNVLCKFNLNRSCFMDR